MKFRILSSVWRFVVTWRYLLLACLVLVVTAFVEYLLLRSPAPLQKPPSLCEKYPLIRGRMTTEEVEGILGPPVSKEVEDYGSHRWFWEDERENLCLVRFLPDKTAYGKALLRTGHHTWEKASLLGDDSR